MNRRTLSLAVSFLVPLVLVLGAASRAGDRPEPADLAGSLRATMGEAAYAACGLEKLAPEEIEQLVTVLVPQTAPSHLEASAVRYLEAEGWRPVSVVGLLRDPEDSREVRLVVVDGYDVVLLRPWAGSGKLPPPGAVWARNVLSSWTLLLPDGAKRDFLVRDF